jgi:hypothetical protein
VFQVEEEPPCRIVVTTQDLGVVARQPPTAILLSSVPDPSLSLSEESPEVRNAVELLPSLTAPPPPPAVIVQQQPATLALPASVLEQSQELTESNLAGRSVLFFFLVRTSVRLTCQSVFLIQTTQFVISDTVVYFFKCAFCINLSKCRLKFLSSILGLNFFSISLLLY